MAAKPNMFVEVAIPLNVHQTFTYRVPEGLTDQVRRGCRVVVPFGRQMLTGYVVEIEEGSDDACGVLESGRAGRRSKSCWRRCHR
jgi:primosomal protein N'